MGADFFRSGVIRIFDLQQLAVRWKDCVANGRLVEAEAVANELLKLRVLGCEVSAAGLGLIVTCNSLGALPAHGLRRVDRSVRD